MAPSSLVFVDVDTQRDFLEPDGSLYIAGSEAIAGRLAELTRFARTFGVPVLATACAHELDEEDPEPFPPHCLAGTRGQERIDATSWSGPDVVIAPRGRLDSGFDAQRLPEHLTIEKQRYDVFSHPEADRIVALYNQGRPVFRVYGVATDYCVRCAVLGLLARDCKVEVVVDAIRAVDPAAESDVLAEFSARGATLITTDVACSLPS